MDTVEILDKTCVNSKWIAAWLALPGQEHCECIGCKVKISWRNYQYIATRKDIDRLIARSLGKTDEVPFDLALPYLQNGKKIARKCWRARDENGKWSDGLIWVELVPAILPTEEDEDPQPWMRLVRPEMSGSWIPGQNDLFANDWYVIEKTL